MGEKKNSLKIMVWKIVAIFYKYFNYIYNKMCIQFSAKRDCCKHAIFCYCCYKKHWPIIQNYIIEIEIYNINK
jgi:hypothetical protein